MAPPLVGQRTTLRVLVGFFIAIAALGISNRVAAADPVSLHQRVLAVYNFSTHTLSKDEIATKSKSLDAFWTEVKANPNALPCPR